MALSSSGSISMSQIQSEWGGSNPIGLNEYYLGSLSNATNQSSVAVTPSISSASASIYTPGTKLIGAYTTYYYSAGFKNSNIKVSSQFPALGASSQGVSRTINADNSGNAGTIPSSGAISFDHFRGTAKGTTSTITVYGWSTEQYSGGITGGFSPGFLFLYIGGHWGGSSELAGNWTGTPFNYFSTNAVGNSVQMPATTWYAGTNTANGANGAQSTKTHRTYPNVGNVTEFTWALSGTNAFGGFSGTVTMTFQF